LAGAILIVLAVLFPALSAIAIVYVIGIRSKSSAVRSAARRFHHALGNPPQMRSAGAGYVRIRAQAFLAAIRRLSEGGGSDRRGRVSRRSLDAATAMAYIRNFASSWAKAKPATKATMVRLLYEEVVVRGSEFVSVRLTPEAYAHGLALAPPQEVVGSGHVHARTAAEKLGIGAPDRIQPCGCQKSPDPHRGMPDSRGIGSEAPNSEIGRYRPSTLRGPNGICRQDRIPRRGAYCAFVTSLNRVPTAARAIAAKWAGSRAARPTNNPSTPSRVSSGSAAATSTLPP
jgi:hypothetical protein